MFSIDTHTHAPQKRPASRSCAGFTVLLAALWFSGCATPDANPQETVRKLANQRWQHVLTGKYDKSYEMLVPSYRKIKSKDNYTTESQMAPVRYKSAEVVRVDCEQKTCKVVVKLISQLIMPTFFRGPLESGSNETWIFEEGQWWKLETL